MLSECHYQKFEKGATPDRAHYFIHHIANNHSYAMIAPAGLNISMTTSIR